jgi:hypothetical protein
MKTTKGGKVMNPTDAYRKELRKKELKRNKKERKKVREVGILKKDPDAIKEQIRKLEMMSAWAFSFLCFTYIGCCIVCVSPTSKSKSKIECRIRVSKSAKKLAESARVFNLNCSSIMCSPTSKVKGN